MQRWFTILAAAFALLGVLMGAFAAHGLENTLTPDMLAVFETGARYHMYHALALLGVAWATERFGGKLPLAAGWLFVAGILIFSGTLYALAISGVRWLGAITPIGGVCFLGGWLMLLIAAARSPAKP